MTATLTATIACALLALLLVRIFALNSKVAAARKERGEANEAATLALAAEDDANERAENGWAAVGAAERAVAVWVQRALDAELGIGLLDDEMERMEAAPVADIATKRAARKPRGVAK